MKKKLLFSLLIIFSYTVLYAHGVYIETELNPPYVKIKAGFSAKSALKDARVDVFIPETGEVFQKGRTDSYGYFVFIPQQIGIWKIIIDDELGHKKTLNLNINEDFFNISEGYKEIIEEVKIIDTLCAEKDFHHHHACHHTQHDHVPLFYKIIFGIALIFGLTGIFYGLKSRK